MCRSFHVLKNKKGIVLIWTALFLTAALGLTALAVDVGYIYIISNELKSVADSGALTAAAAFLSEMRAASAANNPPNVANVITQTEGTCRAIIARSYVLSNAADLTITLQFGQYNMNSNQPYDEKAGSPRSLLFTDMTAALTPANIRDISAFRVEVARSGAGQVQTFFARIFNVASLSLARNSVAALAPRNFMMVIDTSGSMDDMTYPRTAAPSLTATIGADGTVQLPATVWPPTESFISRPSESAFPILYSPLAPAPNPPLFPEPLQTVLNSSLQFLTGLNGQASQGDMAGVYYFAASSSAKIAGQGTSKMISVSLSNIANVFTPLFSNTELYGHLIPAAPITLPNGVTVTDPPDPIYKYNGAEAYDPVLEQYSGPIAIPQGNTNIGDAIFDAVQGIIQSQFASKSISIIVLFTDGMPDCAPAIIGGPAVCYGTGATAAQLAAARNHTLQQAQLAIQQNIRIYPITYGDLGGAAEAVNTQLLFDTIAQLSGLPQHFHIAPATPIAAALQAIFDQISLFVPFSLVG